MNHAFEFAELTGLVQQLRQLMDLNQTHACLVTEQQYNQLPPHFRQYITQRMNELQLQPAIGPLSERVRRPIGMLIYRRIRAIQGITVDSLIQQNLIRPVDEVYGRLDNMEQNIQQVQENIQQLQGDFQQLQGTVQQLQGNIQQIMNHFQIPPAQGP